MRGVCYVVRRNWLCSLIRLIHVNSLTCSLVKGGKGRNRLPGCIDKFEFNGTSEGRNSFARRLSDFQFGKDSFSTSRVRVVKRVGDNKLRDCSLVCSRGWKAEGTCDIWYPLSRYNLVEFQSRGQLAKLRKESRQLLELPSRNSRRRMSRIPFRGKLKRERTPSISAILNVRRLCFV